MMSRDNPRTDRRGFLKTLGAGAGIAALSPLAVTEVLAGKSKKKPNVIVIYADDLDFEWMSCYGGKVKLPHIDSLARDGIKFAKGYVSCPVCTPSRYTILTGRYGTRAPSLPDWNHPHGGYVNLQWNTFMAQDEVNLPKILQANGYRTGVVGKWDQSRTEMQKLAADADPLDPAVDKVVKENYKKIQAEVKTFGFDYVEAIYRNNLLKMPIPKKLQDHNQEWVTKGALDFIEGSKDKPFYLYMALTLPHWPGGKAGLAQDPRYTLQGVLEEAPKVQPSRQSVFDRAAKDGGGFWNACALIWMDDGVGAVLDKLDELGIAEDTLVLFISDNQTMRGKMTCYQAANVPWLARWLGVTKPGTVSDKLVSNIDVATTIYDAAGITPPEGVKHDGESFLPLLEGKSYKRKDLYLEGGLTRGVVDENGWKYIAFRVPQELRDKFGDKVTQHGSAPKDVWWKTNEHYPAYYDADQLYNLNDDPGEQVNLYGDPKYSKIVKKLKQRLKEYCAELPHSFGEFKP